MTSRRCVIMGVAAFECDDLDEDFMARPSAASVACSLANSSRLLTLSSPRSATSTTRLSG